jgi:flagellar basal body P-ring formation protein FlgA
MRQIGLVLLIGALLGIVEGAMAEAPKAPSPTIRMQGRAEAIVTDGVIRLGDIAQIDSPNVQDDEAIIHLKKITVGTSPKAGESAMIEGTQVLERLRDEGIRLDSLRYSLPRQIAVTRAFREVRMEELERALTSFIAKGDKQVEVKQLIVEKPVRIPTDSLGLEVVALQTTKPGHIGVDYRSVAGSDEVRFQLRAVADEWRLMPVATRPLLKGAVLTANDVQLAKINGTSVGRDSVENVGDIVGRSLIKDIGQGEMFKASAVVVPPVIAAGTRVTIVFRQNRLEVTASGIALENGGIGQDIKVRNDSSKKVVVGKVVEAGLVMVGGH